MIVDINWYDYLGQCVAQFWASLELTLYVVLALKTVWFYGLLDHEQPLVEFLKNVLLLFLELIDVHTAQVYLSKIKLDVTCHPFLSRHNFF